MKSINDERLAQLTDHVEDLSRRHSEQQATLTTIRQKLQQTREDDLNREALALSNGTDKPRPKAPSVQRALENAEHDAEVLERALSMAQADVGRYYAENAHALAAKVQDAKAAKAKEISEQAAPLLATLRGFYQVDEDAKILKPYRQPPAESTDKGRDVVAFLGVPQTTANAFGADKIAGLHRGELEGVISALVNLPAQYQETTVLEPGSTDGEAGAA
jgi:hypothetical protein